MKAGELARGSRSLACGVSLEADADDVLCEDGAEGDADADADAEDVLWTRVY